MHGVWDMQLLKDDQLELEAIVREMTASLLCQLNTQNLLYMLAAFVILENKNSITGWSIYQC